MTPDMENFLRRIAQYDGACTSQEAGLADRKADRARQACRRQKLAYFEGGYWRLTEAGKEWLRGP